MWWYWLTLASVIGIPMLLAARYVQRRRAEGEQDMDVTGRKAARIFWYWAMAFAAIFLIAGAMLIHSLEFQFDGLAAKHELTYEILFYDFICCFILANFAVRNLRECSSWLPRIFGTLLWMAVWWVISPVSVLINPLYLLAGLLMGFGEIVNTSEFRIVVATLLFVACLPIAYLRQQFLDQPTRRTARQAFIGICVCAFLFYAAARWGDLAHYYIYQAARGEWPSMASAIEYTTR